MLPNLALKSLTAKWNMVGYFGVSLSFISDFLSQNPIATLTQIGGLILVLMSIYKMGLDIRNAKKKNKESLK